MLFTATIWRYHIKVLLHSVPLLIFFLLLGPDFLPPVVFSTLIIKPILIFGVVLHKIIDVDIFIDGVISRFDRVSIRRQLD